MVSAPGLPYRLRTNAVMRFSALIIADALCITFALCLAFWLRFDTLRLDTLIIEQVTALNAALPTLLLLRVTTMTALGLHRWSFRRSGLYEAVRIVVGTSSATVAFVILFFFVERSHFPRSVVAMEFCFTTMMVVGFRFAPRIIESWYFTRRRHDGAHRTIIVGAGAAGDLLLRDLDRSTDHSYQVVGFVDDDPVKLRTSLGGRPVLGSIDLLGEMVARYRVSKVLISIANLPADRVRRLLALCEKLKITFKIVPPSFLHRDARVTAAMLHDLSPEDLIPRESVAFEVSQVRSLVEGRRILILGAAGSIGSEIARQVAEHKPELLALIDVNENDLYFLHRRLEAQHPHLKIHSEIANIREPERMIRLGQRLRPQNIFHAAAHKHVPLMEQAPAEAVQNNVFGTLHVARMAQACRAERFVLISTDKAVRPSSVMGATKRVAELIVRDFDRTSPHTRFSAVRFGNVLGSAGSVVPLFKEQIASGLPVTVTHPDCTRYFMTIPEAAGLVVLSGLGGTDELYVLDMGEPVRIRDLAANLITMAGLVPNVDVPIIFTGLRPGEKLREELLTEEEEETRLVRDKIFVAKCAPPPTDLFEKLEELRRFAAEEDREGILRALRRLVPSFTPDVQPLRVDVPAPRVVNPDQLVS